LLTILYPFCYILFACLAWWCFKRFKQKGVLNLLMEHSEYFSFEIDYEFISLFFIFSSILRNYVSDFSDLRENKTNFSTSKRILHILGRACGFGWYNQTITELGQLLFLNMKANFIHFESHFIIFSLFCFLGRTNRIKNHRSKHVSVSSFLSVKHNSKMGLVLCLV